MKKLVLDSSVFLKQFLDENDSSQAVDFLTKILTKKIEIIVPDLFRYEVLSTMAKEHQTLFDEALESIENYQFNVLNIVVPSLKNIKKAKSLTEIGHNKSGFPSFYDAIYHALAIENNCYFVTSDKKHYEKTRHLGHVKLLSQVA